MNLKYSEIHDHLMKIKDAIIQDELRKVDLEGPLTAERRQQIRQRIGSHKPDLIAEDPPEHVIEMAKEIITDIGATGGERDFPTFA